MDKDRISGKNKNKYKSNRMKSTGKVTSLDSVRKKVKEKNNKNKAKSNVYYSLLTIVLLIFLSQIGFSAILNISKTISYQTKIVQIKKIRDDAEAKNKKLKKEIREFSKTESLEAIARNNLKLAGEDEVLILINDNESKEQQSQKKKKGMFGNDRQQ